MQIDFNWVKVDNINKFIYFNYFIFSSGNMFFEKYAFDFVIELVNSKKYTDYKIIIDQSSEPISNAGKQSSTNGYLNNYKLIAPHLKNKEVYFISDNSSKEFKEWIKKEFGWKHITYHFHFSNIVTNLFLEFPIKTKSDSYKKKIIIINGNMDNEHKSLAKKMMTDLNLWDISYWSFGDNTNFGMEIYQHSKNLFMIFQKLIPLFENSFLYVVTETSADNTYTDTNIRVDFMSKMGRALILPMPFVVIGNMGVLKHLKELGFKTFSDWFDESYDDIENLEKRMKKIKDLIKSLTDITIEEQLKIRNEMMDIFIHNRKILNEMMNNEEKNINLEIPNFLTKFGYEPINYEIMEEYNINKFTIFYHKNLDGGGTTFGINALNSPNVKKQIKSGNILEICSGPGFMGFWTYYHEYAKKLFLLDINSENEEYINKTIDYNTIGNNTKFKQSNVFDSFTDNIIFDTIISNPPHFKTQRPGGYRNENEKLISLDENMEFHIKFFKDVKRFMDKNSRIILIENCDGVTEEDIREMTKNDFRVELVEYNKYGWQGESTFYTIILYLL